RKLGLTVSLRHERTRVLSLRSALESIPEPGWGMHGRIGPTSFDALLACPPRCLRSLAGRLLGDVPDEALDGDSLTAFEESMAELLMTELLKAFGDAWPGAEPLNCRPVGTVVQPQRTRMYPPRATLVVTTFQIGAGSGEAPSLGGERLVLTMPQLELEDLIEVECSMPTGQRAKPHPAIPRIMRDVPVAVTVELGRTSLSMSELTSLQSGDVVILEQPVSRPLNVLVGETLKFRGRPGRLGTRRCLEIQQLLEDASDALSQ
ncbi:MAG: FliM/FliN family flagellar motor switch protein, partial [Planctomycetaceae bacterium]|nr:FliM/FliN family flagellar motor switch protein [Planctomycetaceae bacterium]